VSSAAQDWDDRYAASELVWSTGPHVFVEQFAEGLRPGRVLDVCYLHLPARRRRLALQSAARAVAPGGALLVVAHHTDNLTGGVGGPQDAAVLYSESDVREDLDGTGLDVQRAERVSRVVVTEAGERLAWDALVAAARP